MSKTRRIEIDFPVAVSLPCGWEQTLNSLVAMVCGQYKKENIDRAMWVSGYGCKLIGNEPHEPEFDDSIYHVEVAECEDLHGTNPYNPKRDELRKDVGRRAHFKFNAHLRKNKTQS